MGRSQQLNKYRLAAAVLMLLSAAMFGCGSSEEPTGSISGSVKAKGELVGDCRLMFVNPESFFNLAVTVNEQGDFTLDEVPFGEYLVSVGAKPNNDPIEVADLRIPKKYLSKETSGISVLVNSEEEVTLNIEMD